jgi:radical SAM superfamily enzyme YgiQ (UPF0313 family)
MDLALTASILEEAGYRVDLWDTFTTPTLGAEEVALQAQSKAPDLLILRPLHGCDDSTIKILQATECKGTTRLLIGPQASETSEELLGKNGASPLAEGAFIGEPELTLIDLIPHLKDGTWRTEVIPGFRTCTHLPFRPRAFNTDLDSLPLPAHHLLVNQGYQFRYPLDVNDKLNIGYVLTSRGCALQCIFCAPVERETFGTKYRWRSASRIVDELELLQSLGVNAVYFIDDFFGFSNRRIQELCEEMLARDVILPWAAQIRAQGIDLALLKLMRRAGCSTLCFGAESGSNRLLKVLRKGVTTEQIRAQAERIHQAQIQLVGYFIVGIPSETAEERESTYQLIRDIRPAVAQIHIFNVFPGAEAMTLFPDQYSDTSTKFTGPDPSDSAIAQLDRERRRFYRDYYLSPRYLTRTLRRRWRPLWANMGQELDFVKRTTRFFLGWT